MVGKIAYNPAIIACHTVNFPFMRREFKIAPNQIIKRSQLKANSLSGHLNLLANMQRQLPSFTVV
jgi:hypothetical protein